MAQPARSINALMSLVFIWIAKFSFEIGPSRCLMLTQFESPDTQNPPETATSFLCRDFISGAPSGRRPGRSSIGAKKPGAVPGPFACLFSALRLLLLCRSLLGCFFRRSLLGYRLLCRCFLGYRLLCGSL